MLNWVEGITIEATKAIRPADNIISISRKDAVKLNTVGTGNYIYLTLQLYGCEGVSEVVRYTHNTAIPTAGCASMDIAVDRDINGTGKKAFPVYTRATSQLNKPTLVEFIHQVMGA